jgi:hypothetical protein
MIKIYYSGDQARPILTWPVEQYEKRTQAEAAAIELLMAGYYVSWDESEAEAAQA